MVMFYQHIFAALLIIECVETIFIERKLYGDVITNISKDECKISENTEWEKDICTCGRGYETAIVVENKVKCKNRSEILKSYDSSRCTIFGHSTDETRIVVVRGDGVFILNKKQKVLEKCLGKHGTKIELLYPQKQVISINWTFQSSNDYPYVKLKLITAKYAGYLIRINNICNGICIVAKVTGRGIFRSYRFLVLLCMELVGLREEAKTFCEKTKTCRCMYERLKAYTLSRNYPSTKAVTQSPYNSINLSNEMLLLSILPDVIIFIILSIMIVFITRLHQRAKKKKNILQPVGIVNAESGYAELQI
ncbi:uncharacterized protein LOC130649137 isoform X2 [Hydractinia symbiolongicarpus]|uniref:uncharacterized protein LOC130649137 isoform X2 n=1 Tax=Hydractinia symbiolongicarpus TaxID=13093 RepID=UPI00254A0AAD|nr:uncharacterized protein LOC130649137 isoform X2 [Hydractinia symbiolongicarpus]